MQFLKEINRVNEEANVIIDYLSERIGLEIEDVAFDIIMKAATKIIWTRDPFDRIIVATSQVKNSTLITADQNILDNYQNAIW